MDAPRGPLLLLGFLLVGFISQEVLSCGIVTHINIGQRATEYFEVESGGVDYRQLMLKHPDAFQAGHPFPDAFYNSLCKGGQFHQVSEDTHWTPFANATVNYIRRKYPQPWTDETEKLVAFLFGIVSHSVADTTWHSLGIDQGFLRAMGNVNFHGSFGDAHNTGDFGGDVVNMVESDVHQINILDNWYIPVDDMVEIYREYYGYDRMDNATITECAMWMYLGRAGERLGVINLLYPMYSNKSPFLANRMQDYFLGAMDDMVAWTTNGWRNIITMIDHGTSACELTENPLYIDCSGNANKQNSQGVVPGRVAGPKGGTNDESYIKKMVGDMDDSFITTERTERGVHIKAGDKLKERVRIALEKLNAKKEMDITHEQKPATHAAAALSTAEAYYDTTNNYARLGRTLLSADMNNDGHMDLVIGAPGHGSMGNYMQGRVYIVYGTADGLPNRNLTLDIHADVIFDGPEKNGMFGHALAVVDLNCDGVNDLAISAPSVGAPKLKYNGEVYVFLGSAAGGVSTQPNITLKCTQKYCNLGWSLTSGKVNGDNFADLIIGAPFAPAGGEQNGFVAALYATSSIITKAKPVLYETDFDWVSNGPRKYSWYGYDVSVSSSHMVIGAPTYKFCVWEDCKADPADIQAAGKVFVFTTPLTSGASASHTLLGNKEFDYMGARVLLGNFAGSDNVLAFSVPTRNVGLILPTKQAGVTRVYDVSSTFGLVKKVEYQGKRGQGRFGMGSWFEDVNGDGTNDIVLGSPFWTDGFWFDSGALRGRVFVFYGGGASGNVKNADLELSYHEDGAKFGTSVTSVRGTTKVNLAVGAPGSNAGAKLSGRVAVFSRPINTINY